MDCMVLKGSSIGDNCFIGAGSIVTHNIPANSIAAGRPAKVICRLDDYYKRRQSESIEETYEYIRCFVERNKRKPTPLDLSEEFGLYVDYKNIEDYSMLPIRKTLGLHYEAWLKQHEAPFSGIDELIDAALSDTNSYENKKA